MKIAITLLLALLAVAQPLFCRHSPLGQACFWLLDFCTVLGCGVLFFSTAPLDFHFLTAPLFWQNMAAFVAVTGVVLLLAPPKRRNKKAVKEKSAAPAPEVPGADTATLFISLFHLLLLLGAGAGGLICLWATGKGWLPDGSWQGVTGYCLLWLLPLSLRQLLRLRCVPPQLPAVQDTAPASLLQQYHRL